MPLPRTSVFGAGGSLFDKQTTYPHTHNGSFFDDQMAPFSIDKYNLLMYTALQ